MYPGVSWTSPFGCIIDFSTVTCLKPCSWFLPMSPQTEPKCTQGVPFLAFRISINGSTILLVAQTQNLRVILDIFLFIYLAPNPFANSVMSVLRVCFSPPPLLPQGSRLSCYDLLNAPPPYSLFPVQKKAGSSRSLDRITPLLGKRLPVLFRSGFKHLTIEYKFSHELAAISHRDCSP